MTNKRSIFSTLSLVLVIGLVIFPIFGLGKTRQEYATDFLYSTQDDLYGNLLVDNTVNPNLLYMEDSKFPCWLYSPDNSEDGIGWRIDSGQDLECYFSVNADINDVNVDGNIIRDTVTATASDQIPNSPVKSNFDSADVLVSNELPSISVQKKVR